MKDDDIKIATKTCIRNGLVVHICAAKLRGQPYKRTVHFNGVAPSGGAGGNCGIVTSAPIK